MTLSTLIKSLQQFESNYGNLDVMFHADDLGGLTSPRFVYLMYPPPWDGALNYIVLDDTYTKWGEWFHQ
jgi:hypothetical protein